MKAFGWLAVGLLALGCAPAQKAQPPKAARRTAPLKVVATHELLELPALGLALRPPGPAAIVETEQTVADGPMLGAGVFCAVEGQEYLAVRYFRGGRDRAGDDEALGHIRKSVKVSRDAPAKMGEWRGLELEGMMDTGRPVWMRAFLAGDGLWLVQVQAPVGGKLDREPARAFLDSVVLTQPWSVHAFPESHFSVLMPDGGVEMDKAALNLEDFPTGQGSWLGGVESRSFVVASAPLEGESSPDERMDLTVKALVQAGNRLIWEGPFEFDGARGRDFLMQGNDTWFRLRVVVTNTDLFMLQASARTKQGLLDESVARFMASLRWY
jgi:hypothetical protein